VTNGVGRRLEDDMPTKELARSRSIEANALNAWMRSKECAEVIRLNRLPLNGSIRTPGALGNGTDIPQGDPPSDQALETLRIG
jgi:hypothetical protein